MTKRQEKLHKMDLGDRMKFYESEYEIEVKPEQHLIVRIDGHKFSKFTKGFNKPFDSILSKAMELCTIDLLDEFTAYTAYTQSDEITLVLPSLMNRDKHKGQNKPTWKHTSSGRVQKLASLIAGFTTMSFNKHLRKLVEDGQEYNESASEELRKYWNLISTKKVGNAWFDARVYGVDSDEEAYNSVMWRVRDCVKNSKSVFAQTYCSHTELQNKTGPEQVQYCLEKTGEDWEEVEDRYKFGILVKKELYNKTTFVEQQDCEITVQRSRVISFSQELTSFSDESVQLIMEKYKG
jgi:tRNA(His) 5'-end guanylyltransferase